MQMDCTRDSWQYDALEWILCEKLQEWPLYDLVTDWIVGRKGKPVTFESNDEN